MSIVVRKMFQIKKRVLKLQNFVVKSCVPYLNTVYGSSTEE